MYRALLVLTLATLLVPSPAHAQVGVGPAPRGETGGFRGFQSPRLFHRHGFPGGQNLFPVFYPSFYDDAAYSVVAPPPSVVVIRDDRNYQAQAAPQPQPPLPPKVIEISPSEARPRNPQPPLGPTVFILSDGRKLEAQRYIITYTAVDITEARRPVVRIPMEQLDIEATLAANHQRGRDLQLPQSRSELYLSF